MEENRQEQVEISEEITQIIPKSKYLSATELINLRNKEISNASAGLKKSRVENSPEEQQELEKLYDQLQGQLSRPRIERLVGRAVGVWDSIKNLVRVKRKDGKFGNFGFSIDGQLYLEYYEAMFLLEVNRLQLEYNSTVLSVEQAYLLLMGEQHSAKYNEYLVYSNLTRVGYILVKHHNVHFQTQTINSEVDCVWAILEAELQDATVADYVKKSSYYGKVKQNFDIVKNKIKNQIGSDTQKELQEEPFDTTNVFKFMQKTKPNLKRKANEYDENKWSTAKRHCNYATKILQHSLVDFLKDEDEYKQFKELFEKFDLVRLKSNDNNKDSVVEEESEEETEEPANKFSINFDVYLHNEGFRKSAPHLPNFRVIILGPQEKFPTHDEILAAYRQQLNPVSVLIVSVNDSKQMHAFLYYFS